MHQLLTLDSAVAHCGACCLHFYARSHELHMFADVSGAQVWKWHKTKSCFFSKNNGKRLFCWENRFVFFSHVSDNWWYFIDIQSSSHFCSACWKTILSMVFKRSKMDRCVTFNCFAINLLCRPIIVNNIEFDAFWNIKTHVHKFCRLKPDRRRSLQEFYDFLMPFSFDYTRNTGTIKKIMSCRKCSFFAKKYDKFNFYLAQLVYMLLNPSEHSARTFLTNTQPRIQMSVSVRNIHSAFSAPKFTEPSAFAVRRCICVPDGLLPGARRHFALAKTKKLKTQTRNERTRQYRLYKWLVPQGKRSFCAEHSVVNNIRQHRSTSSLQTHTRNINLPTVYVIYIVRRASVHVNRHNNTNTGSNNKKQ